jgi:hypothetical protein
MKESNKCAPHIQFDNESCISLDLLIDMAKAYNIANKNNKIILQSNYEILNARKYKRYLLDQFKEKLKNKCDNQQCWIEQDFTKQMSKLAQVELKKYTFRPPGPEGKFDWLNTININDVLTQYQKKHDDFLFLGAVPIDFDDIYPHIKKLDLVKLYNDGIYKIGIIFNLDESWKDGSHWVGLYADSQKGQIYYFDSYGIRPEYRIRKLMRRMSIDMVKILGVKPSELTIEYNDIQHQRKGTECGTFCIDFIERMLEGESFKHLTEVITTDEKVNKKRNIYFKG